MAKNNSSLSLKDFFEKYSIQFNKQSVLRYTLPPHTSVFDMLTEAQTLSLESRRIVAVYPSRLQKWSRRKEFLKKSPRSREVIIDPAVKGSEFKTREEQLQFLRSHYLTQAGAPELAAAHTAYFVKTGKDLFDGNIIRVKGTKLYYGDGGLSEMDETDYINNCRYQRVKTAGI